MNKTFFADIYKKIIFSLFPMCLITITATADIQSKSPNQLEQTQLFKKVYGALIGAAIGDAMGGPVEFWSHEKIKSVYGKMDRLIEYSGKPHPHGPWAIAAGSYTDDTRMLKIFCQAIVDKKGVPTDKDLAKTFINYYHSAPTGLAKEFIEEYYLKSIYRQDKQVFGGQPTNGALMGIAPFGIINACNPRKAFKNAHNTLFTAEGYARLSAAMAAAAIASAMKPDITVEQIIKDTFDAIKYYKSKVEGPLWKGNYLYPIVAAKNEDLVRKGIEIAQKNTDPNNFAAEILNNVQQQFGCDAAETLAISIAAFYISDGDYVKSVVTAVNCGRDNDSSASVAGAIAGAYCGIDKIPSEWINTVEKTNPKPKLKTLAIAITKIITEQHKQDSKVIENIDKLVR